ncbi:MAG TPA: FG-GAP-like repeat-containing protein, partial [Candidatus Krumholzibacteria bacterium]|nr:FG-GAP-like repeat-containing protein [Candidatus Krumholzibacteria bacterium]
MFKLFCRNKMAVISAVLCLYASGAFAATPELIFSKEGLGAGDWMGLMVSRAGDLNGDGIGDFLVGAPYADGPVQNTGAVYIYFGGPGLDSDPDLTLLGEANGDQFGLNARGVGDVNDDGWDDVLVGAPNNDAGGYNSGRLYLYFGGPGLDAVPDLVITGTGSEQLGWSVAGPGDLDGGGNDFAAGAPSANARAGMVYVYNGGASLDGVADYSMPGAASTWLGWFTNRAGDFDGDGWDDLLVGANSDRYAYLFRGGADFDSIPDFVFTGEALGDRFGYGLGPAGDFNGDGWDDIVIGGMHNDAAGFDAGRAYLYYGGPNPDVTADMVFTGFLARDLLGRTVDGSGDLNGDGYSDLLVGAPTPDVGGFGPGRLHVYFGGDPNGVAPPDTTADILIGGEYDSDRMGAQVGIVPDMNGDGRDDILVGANLYDGTAGANSGKFYLYSVPNRAPVALADSAVLALDLQPVVIDVLANDTDDENAIDPTSVVLVQAPLQGLAVVDTLTGVITYTPDPGFAGTDTLAYTVADTLGAVSEPGVVTILGPDLTPPAPLDMIVAAGGAGAVAVSWQGVPVDADSLEVWHAVWADSTGATA